jgi:DNA polymerase-3 subunit gamma/tau
MSHLALYRKYRPEDFDQVMGQDAITDSLKASLKSGKISHAYLFTGSRGTGKTSVARIFAKALGTTPNDLYEIDAASNNGVDEIRELRDGVNTLPFDSKYKVYILDEVHMLSKAAFNALLKTLEEPPAHVIFILATTEPHKVLDTVKSRCQIFEFKKPGLEDLVLFVQDGAKKEKREVTDEAADLIARFADGAYRDAWGTLERVLQSTDKKKIEWDDVVALVGASHRDLVNNFVSAIVENNLDEALAITHKASENDNMEVFLQDVVQLFRVILLRRFAPAFGKTAMEGFREDLVKNVEKWAGEKNVVNAQLLVEFLHLLDETKKTSMPQIPVELALMRILGQNTTV